MSLKYIIGVLIITVYGCNITMLNGQCIKGKYTFKKNKVEEHLIFNHDSTFYYEKNIKPTMGYSDTLSFGRYSVDSNVITLNSHYQESFGSKDDFINNILVEEEIIEDSDMIYFIISNKFEEMIMINYKDMKSPLRYQIETGSDIFLSKDNIIKIPKSDFASSNFALTVVVNNDEFLGNSALSTILCGFYNIINDESNYFKITIPDLTTEYLTCIRLYSEYLIIKSDDIIMWHGNEYIKQK